MMSARRRERPMGGPKGRASRQAWVWGRKGVSGRTTLDVANHVAGSSRGRPQTTGGARQENRRNDPGRAEGGESRPRRSRSIARMRRARPARSDTRSGTGRPGSPKGRRGKPSTDAPTDAGEDRCNRPRDATRSSAEPSPWSCTPWASTVARAYIRVSPTHLALNSPSAANRKSSSMGLTRDVQANSNHGTRMMFMSSSRRREFRPTMDSRPEAGRSDGVEKPELGDRG